MFFQPGRSNLYLVQSRDQKRATVEIVMDSKVSLKRILARILAVVGYFDIGGRARSDLKSSSRWRIDGFESKSQNTVVDRV